MNYRETIDWLENIPTSFDSNYRDYKLKLDSVVSFLNFLDNPQKSLNFIHVGGTNGKGSTCHIISSILQEHNFQVGLFSSPHIYDFRERIKINADLIEKNFIVEFVELNKSYIIKNNLSFFEISFALSLQYFKYKKVDFSVIEVGLGGRLDSTNIISPLVSVITNIGYDHKKFLGNSLSEIANEKAGIFKYNVPAVIGEFDDVTSKVFNDQAEKIDTNIFYVDQSRVNYETDLRGSFQYKNINTAIFALKMIDSLSLEESKIFEGIRNVCFNTKLIGRWDIVMKNPTVIFDVAHNVNSLQIIFDELKNIPGSIKVIFGTLDKIDQLECLDIFPKQYKYYFCEASVNRSMPIKKLERYANKININYCSFETPNLAFQKALYESKIDDTILVTGSTYLFSQINLENN